MPRLTKQQQKLVLQYMLAQHQAEVAVAHRANAWDQLLRAVTADQMVVIDQTLQAPPSEHRCVRDKGHPACQPSGVRVSEAAMPGYRSLYCNHCGGRIYDRAHDGDSWEDVRRDD